MLGLLFLVGSVHSAFRNAAFSNDFQTCSRPFSSKYFQSDDGYMRIAQPLSWTDCSSPSALFKLESLTISPDPPQRSSPLTVNVRGYLKERLDSGMLNYTASFGGLQLIKGSEDGCSLLAREDGNLPQCPIEAGLIEVTHTAQIPWHVPPGRYLIDFSVERKDDRQQVICLKLDVSIDLISKS